MRSIFLGAAAALSLLLAPISVSAQSTTCAVCVVLLALGEQMNNQTSTNPETTCKDLGLCDGTCSLFNGTWPVPSPVFPTDGGATDARRRRLETSSSTTPPPHDMSNSPFPTTTLSASSSELLHLMSMIQEEEAKHRALSPNSFTILEAITSLSRRFWSQDSWLGPCQDGLNITCDISRVFDAHLPLIDSDNDTYAGGADGDFLTHHFRGSNWRGKDCNDTLSDVYPGRRYSNYGPEVDHNCNGIYGSDAQGRSYEELFCNAENAPLGVAIFGDSAAAHFHLPPQYVNARSFNLSGILELAANEADWPACSWSTSYHNASDCPKTALLGNVTAQSIYQRMLSRNLCMHRDFANLGVNGARTDAMPDILKNSYWRNPVSDASVLGIFALIGNDVCNGHPGSDSMTTVDEFRSNVYVALDVLNSVLPKGSHIAFLPLADGRVLFNSTHTHTHPLGATYPEVYEYLSCNGANPCWGWLNTNSTWRDFTSERAANLSAVYDEIIAAPNASAYSFDMYKLQVDWVVLVEEYIAAGGNAFDIVEPVDGFHPSQTGSYLLADVIFNDLDKNKPNWLPPVNPNNTDIQKLFGDQGGVLTWSPSLPPLKIWIQVEVYKNHFPNHQLHYFPPLQVHKHPHHPASLIPKTSIRKYIPLSLTPIS